MDLTFQVPMQYCSLQHQTLLPSPVTSTAGCCFCFGSFFSFFLELFLHWSPVAYWAPTDLGSSSFSVVSFYLFILFMGSQGKNTEVVCHSLTFFFFFLVFYFLNFKIFNSYMSSQTWTTLPPPSPWHLSGSSPCTSPKHAFPFSRGPHSVRTLHHDPSVLGGLTWHGS